MNHDDKDFDDGNASQKRRTHRQGPMGRFFCQCQANLGRELKKRSPVAG